MLSTKDIKSEGSVPKIVEPGEVKVKIHSIELEPYTFIPGAYHVILNVETPPVGENFEGFFIDKDYPGKGRYSGQVGKVKMSRWAYNDGITKSGLTVNRDEEILKSLNRLSNELGIKKEFEEMDDKYASIDPFVKAYNNILPKNDVYLRMCLCGKKYTNNAGYPAYELFIPKSSKTSVAYENDNKEENKLIKFNPKEHIIDNTKKDSESVDAFGGESNQKDEFNFGN